MRKIKIGFQISGENIECVGMIFPKFIWRKKIRVPVARDMLEINLRYAWNMLGICLKYHHTEHVFDHPSNIYGLKPSTAIKSWKNCIPTSFFPRWILNIFCPRYPVWSLTIPSLHLTIPQKYIDSLLSATCSKKEVTNFLGVLLYFLDWYSKNICPMYPVWSLTIPSLYLTILPTYIDSFLCLMNTTRYHWVPFGTISYHLLPLCTI